MSTEYRLPYTAQEIEERLGKISDADQTYNRESKNAQSGKAVAGALENFLNKDVRKEISDAILESVDINFDPESEYAQSGLAVAEALSTLDSSENFSNAVKTNKNGKIVYINDVSNIEHTLKIKVASKNLFDKDAVTNGQYINNSTGSTDSAEGYCASDFIPVLEGATYTVSGYVTDDEITRKTAFYNKDKIYITGANIQDTFTVPSGAVYMRKSFATNDLDTIQIEYGVTATSYSPFNITGAKVSRYGKNLFDNVFEYGQILSSDGGAAPTTNPFLALYTPTYIPILPNTKYTMTNPIRNNTQKTRFYDINKNYIGHDMGNTNFIANNAGGSLIRTSLTPKNAYYMRFELDFNNASAATEVLNAINAGEYRYQFELGDPTEFEDFKEAQTATADESGVVAGIKSLSPVMTLVVDKVDAMIDVEYSLDINEASKLIKMDTPYELIETIKLTEDTECSSISRNQEPDGTPYNFKHLLIKCNIKTGSDWDGAYVALWDGPEEPAICYIETIMAGNSPYLSVIKLDSINGLIFAETAHGAWASQTHSPTVSVNSFGRIKGNIKDFEIMTTVGTILPAGSTIEILGVRA